MKKIYIAGFDVFKKDSIEIGKKLVNKCQEYGYKGLYPLDNVVDFNQQKQIIASDIFKANIKMIQQADIIIANLNNFRGLEPDSGTVWECGYGYGLGKDVYGYMKDTSNYIDRFETKDKQLIDGVVYDKNGMIIEDFDYPLNLMLSCSIKEIVCGSFEDVLKKLK
jgi:nucleoside 2-deoxyribosyltransferase